MKTHALALGIAAAALLAVGACNKQERQRQTARPRRRPQRRRRPPEPRRSPPASPPNGRFMAAAKAAGLDQTLAGPGPYTVFVPDDAAFNGGAGRDVRHQARRTARS